MRIRHGLLIASLLTLAGCPLDPAKPTVPKVVTVTVTKYVEVPKEYTEPCPIAEPTNREVEEGLKVAHARKVSLQDCNSQLEKIRSLKPPKSDK